MSNHIRFNGTADSDEWLIISNQGTDCFLDLLISAGDALDKTEHQKVLIDFLKAQKMMNAMAPGTADFDIIDLPSRGECFFEDVQFVLRVIASAKTEEAFARLPYASDRQIVLSWLKKFAAMTGRLLAATNHQEPIKSGGIEYVRSLIPKTKHDDSTIPVLLSLTDPEIEPILPDLLTWLQDINWPIAGSMVKIIGKHREATEPYILEILRSKDEAWKYNVLSYLLYEWSSYPGDALMHEIIRIADHSTAEETEAEVDQAANEFLEAYA